MNRIHDYRMEIKAAIKKAQNLLTRENLTNLGSGNSKLLQSSILFGSMIVTMGLSFVTSIIVARNLEPTLFGDLKFIQIVWSLLAVIITLGYFHSGSRVLVIENDPQSLREITGAILTVSIVMGVIICLISIILANPIDQIFNSQVSTIMIAVAPFGIIIPLTVALPLILQSTNKIYTLSLFNSLPSIFYLLCLLVLAGINKVTVTSVIVTQQVTTLVVIIYVIIVLKPSLIKIRYWFSEIRKQNKTYGGPVYRGSLANVASSYVNRLALSYWVDNTAIGFFSLATSLVEPLKFIPTAVATSSFRGFASQQKISRKVILATAIFTLLAFVAAFIFFGTPFSWFYPESFSEVGTIARILSFGAVMHGFGDLFNRFLGAHGKGKELMSAAYIVGVVNVVGFLVLVPAFGTWGAVATLVLAGGSYFLFTFIFYRKFIN